MIDVEQKRMYAKCACNIYILRSLVYVCLKFLCSVLWSIVMEYSLLFTFLNCVQPHKYYPASANPEAVAIMESMKVGALFGHILLRKYPKIERGDTVDISLEDLLMWSHWPNFIKIYSKVTCNMYIYVMIILVVLVCTCICVTVQIFFWIQFFLLYLVRRKNQAKRKFVRSMSVSLLLCSQSTRRHFKETSYWRNINLGLAVDPRKAASYD